MKTEPDEEESRDKWTDVILNYPTSHFDRLAKIQKDPQRVIAEFKNI